MSMPLLPRDPARGPGHKTEIDIALAPCLDLTLEELDPVELAVLRLSTWELLKRVDVPYRVVINEGIELAKVFGSTDGHKFVNGVLDKLAPRLREAEVKETSADPRLSSRWASLS
jgi:N utilization substance protein B